MSKFGKNPNEVNMKLYLDGKAMEKLLEQQEETAKIMREAAGMNIGKSVAEAMASMGVSAADAVKAMQGIVGKINSVQLTEEDVESIKENFQRANLGPSIIKKPVEKQAYRGYVDAMYLNPEQLEKAKEIVRKATPTLSDVISRETITEYKTQPKAVSAGLRRASKADPLGKNNTRMVDLDDDD